MALFILILRIIRIKLLVTNLIFVNKSNIINKINGNNNNINVTKSKNMVILNFLAKFKWLIEPSSKMSFLTFKARLAFTKLK